MTNDVKTHSVSVGEGEVKFETGRLAHQADGAVLVCYGAQALLVTAGMSDRPRSGIDFFPMMVDFEEKFYAAGRMKGSRFIKREGRPSDMAILNARLVDRPLRPLFPKGITNDVQIICTQLQTDELHSAAPLAITGASMAVLLSGMPFEAPVSGVRVGMNEDGSFMLDPTFEQCETGNLDLVVAGTEEAIMMVEAGANLITNEQMLGALEFAHEAIKKICKAQKEFAATHKITPKTPLFRETTEAEEEAAAEVITDSDLDSVRGKTKKEVKEKLHVLEDKLVEKYATEIEEGTLSEGALKGALGGMFSKNVRAGVFKTGKRADGREIDEIRPIHVEVGLFERLHGSALFQRGETQALSIATVAGPSDAEIFDTPHRPEFTKQYIHHYNFPPYSVGEVRPLRGTNRREIGHGTLAERALLRMIPTKEENYPYVVRVVSEILACNGSSSMASVCGSTLSLMDAGVPIKHPISGIAMGLLVDDSGDYRILTDIQGLEDFDGDMDFKVTGTEGGITALQMDIKVKGLKLDLLKEVLERATVGRASILKDMLAVIPNAREEMNNFAPRIDSFHINPDYIRNVIGKGGETIQKICADFDVKVDIEDDGLVMITGVNQENAKKARAFIDGIVYEPEVGDVFEDATVKNIMDFGAFAEYAPGKEALIHISEIADERVENVNDHLKEGQKVRVKIVGIDHLGRVKLSMKNV